MTNEADRIRSRAHGASVCPKCIRVRRHTYPGAPDRPRSGRRRCEPPGSGGAAEPTRQTRAAGHVPNKRIDATGRLMTGWDARDADQSAAGRDGGGGRQALAVLPTGGPPVGTSGSHRLARSPGFCGGGCADPGGADGRRPNAQFAVSYPLLRALSQRSGQGRAGLLATYLASTDTQNEVPDSV